MARSQLVNRTGPGPGCSRAFYMALAGTRQLRMRARRGVAPHVHNLQTVCSYGVPVSL